MTQSDLSEYQTDGNEQPDDKRGDPDGYKDAETLRNLYWNDGMSMTEIADRFDKSYSAITYHMDKQDIGRRGRGSGSAEAGRDDPLGYSDAETLREMYGEGMSMSDIANHFDVGRGTIQYHMDKHSIERRSESEATYAQWEQSRDHPELTEEWLRELYVEKRLSTRVVANKVGCSRQKVEQRLGRYNIGRRSQSEAARIRNSREPASFFTRQDGYEASSTWYDGKHYGVLIHRLAAVAWFGFDAVAGKVVHHQNKHRWDNREENVELMTNSDHIQHHWDAGDMRY